MLLSDWSAAIFKDQGLPPPYPAACYRAVWSRFSGGEQARFVTASIDRRPVCVLVSFAAEHRAVAWTLAGDRSGKQYSLAVPLMYWDSICWALRTDCAELDLVGAPTEGVARYKRKWAVEERTYSVLRRQSSAHRIATNLPRLLKH